jgi:5-methylcytosine-specific restriction endonuclease McrA
MKQCSYCKLDKHHTDFYISPKTKDGLRRMCIACENLARSARRISERGRALRRSQDRIRRQRKLEIETVIAEEAHVRQLFNNKCFRCGISSEEHKQLYNIDLSLDHHYPLSKQNALDNNNAVLLCRSCNSKKADKLPENFYSETELLQLLTLGIKNVSLRL